MENSSDEFDFNVADTQVESRGDHKTVVQPTPASPPSSTAQPQSASTAQPQPAPNAQPQIPADSAPFIVLCGPPSSGKSMVLKSLAGYLYHSELGYTISANTTLLNTAQYLQNCTYFNSIIGNPNIPMPNTVDYLLADILNDKGEVVAHFLEAPGEDFFSLTNADKEPGIPFKSYLDKVAQVTPGTQRKVIYIILLDLDSDTSFRRNLTLRNKYEQKMVKLYNQYVLHHPSKVILLYNKVDLPQGGLWANANGCTNPSAVKKDAYQNYPKLFFTKRFLFWDIETYSFLPYCTGSYVGGYTASGPVYPSALWREITKIW